ncbi:hypothetical protein AAFF_G00353670 [Aldrovandia affinis]|uniref:Uncharacterized protein n=1 Tax=Aldrovandia affinis TaxID=143900 RepID=A0AAD7R5K9_9TELE|nr:hypothetical protein AAFF_G00353670 [Aldrovandia affinis]
MATRHSPEHGHQASHTSHKQVFRRITFSVTGETQDPSTYDSSKSSTDPALAPPLPDDNNERTSPEGSVGDTEDRENDSRQLPDVALTGKSHSVCEQLHHAAPRWLPTRTASPTGLEGRGQGLSRKMSLSSYSTISAVDLREPCGDPPSLTHIGGCRTTSCTTLPRREAHL